MKMKIVIEIEDDTFLNHPETALIAAVNAIKTDAIQNWRKKGATSGQAKDFRGRVIGEYSFNFES